MKKSNHTPQKMNGNSYSSKDEILELFKAKAPEIFTEGKIDPVKLKATLGESVNVDNERYGLNWAGKSDCFYHIQEPTTSTLKPVKDGSVDFDTTENIFIEGENLQVLKVLQRSYYGKIKMIYIDPPYNTGNDSFIYPDRFQETQDEYLKRIGDKDEEGNLTKEGMFQKNSKDNGHYHSNWLSMMYPRLFLARNLLRQDGVIFVSIDDHEVHNLRAIMNEIFGEENFEGHIHWRRRHNQPNDPTKMIALVAEHILAYSKNQKVFKDTGVGKVQLTGDFSNPDNDPRGDWASKPWRVGSGQSGSKYKITTPTGKIYDEEWMGEESTFKSLLADKRIIFPDNGKGKPRKKYFKFEREKEGQCAINWWAHDNFGHNQGANDEMEKLFGFKNLFDNPKPSLLIKNLISISNCKEDDIILDFFAGSATTAQAAIELNKEDSNNRKFIMVQLSEQVDKKTEAYKAGYNTISDIAKEKIRRVGNKFKKQREQEFNFEKNNPDVGFKLFKLGESNFKIWRSDVNNEKELIEQMGLFVDNVKAKSTQENILYELILKSGLDLNVPLEKKEINSKQYFSLDNDKLIVCLENEINQELIDTILKAKPEKVICLDKSFGGNDQLKTNTTLQMESAKIDFKVI